MLTTCMCKQCGCTFNTESSLFKSMCDTCGKLYPNEEDKAIRYNSGKTRWSLVHFPSLEPMVEVLEYGSKKYAEENWKKPMIKKEILESAMRHLIRLMEGHETDEESGLQEIGHLMCNAMMFSYHSK